jgi:hypothetical protein
MSFKIVRGALAMMSSLLATSSLFAGSAQESCCCVKPNGCQGVTLCHTQPDMDWNRFHVDVGFILEQARVTGAAYAYTAPSLSDIPNTGVTIATPEFDTDFGVIAAIGYDFEHDHWYSNATFKWLSTTGTNGVSSAFGTSVVPMGIWYQSLVGGSNLTAVSTANTNFEINYYDLVLEVGRGMYVTDCLVINPHAALQFSFIYDNVTNTYGGGNLPAGNALIREQETDFWGVGPAFGLDTSWMFSEGWSMFLDTSAAILLSYSTANDSLTNGSTLSTSVTTGQIPTFAPTIRSLLGFSYERKIYCDQQMLRLRAGWDTTIFWNQFNHIDVVNGAGAGTQTGFDSYFLREGNTFGLTGLVLDLSWSF